MSWDFYFDFYFYFYSNFIFLFYFIWFLLFYFIFISSKTSKTFPRLSSSFPRIPPDQDLSKTSAANSAQIGIGTRHWHWHWQLGGLAVGRDFSASDRLTRGVSVVMDLMDLMVVLVVIISSICSLPRPSALFLFHVGPRRPHCQALHFSWHSLASPSDSSDSLSSGKIDTMIA